MLPQPQASARRAAVAAHDAEPDSARKAIAHCRLLLSPRGEVSTEHHAAAALAQYAALDDGAREVFFDSLADDFRADPGEIASCAAAYREQPSAEALAALRHAAVAPREELFRRLNVARGGAAALIEMRRRLLEGSRAHASWRPVADDLAGLLREWFNGGLLELRRIDNGSAPRLLEHVVQYEAVHTIHNALELHRRLEPDRRCFGLFHSALGDEPLAFTEIALTAEMSAEVPPLLDPDSAIADPAACRCAIFYSISSCHDGLRGVSFGNLLIRRAVDALRRELPHLRLFATLSPIPGFRAWLREAARAGDDVAAIAAKAGDSGELDRNPDLRRDLIALCASYLLFAKRGREAADPVARFHLGNGARLERLNWMGDGSPVGMQRSFGLTANYVYSLADVDRNHIEYESGGRIAASHRVELLAASAPL